MNTMKKVCTTLVVAAGVLHSYAYAEGGANPQQLSARLSGFNEVPAAIYTNGTGTLELLLDRQVRTLSYTLSYSGLGSAVTQAHIHFGKKHVAGGIMAFFCSNLANGPAGTPACPENGGTVSGTITAEGVVGPQAQNVSPRDFDALVAALTTRTSYANVHTTQFPAGEIRGEIRSDMRGEMRMGHKEDDNDHRKHHGRDK